MAGLASPMCGRYTHLFTWEELHRLSTLTSPPLEIPKSWNVAPTQSAPIIRMVGPTDSGRELAFLKWGLVPFWAADEKIGNSLINARGETVAEKPAFRAAFKARRCIVPVSGFYEWKRLGEKSMGGKQPHYIRAAADEPLLLAGLWERWKPKDQGLFDTPPLETFTIITTTPNEMMAELHDRMPVIIAPEHQTPWLTGSIEDARSLIQPYPAELMMHYPVSTRVNSPRNNEAALVDRV